MLAAMAAMFPGQVTAVQVGTYFVGQYYPILQQHPSRTYRFYNDASTMLRVDGATTERATTTAQIHALVMSLNYTGIEIKTAHSLDSWNGGVLVMVSGYVQTKDYSDRRKFVQTFFLTPQETGYYVLNDIFHFLNDEPIYQAAASVLTQSNYESNISASKSISEPVSDYVLREETQARDYISPVQETQARDYIEPVQEPQARDYLVPVQAEENETVDKYSISEPQQQFESDDRAYETPAEEPVLSASNIGQDPSASNIGQDPPAPAEEPAGEKPKQTYASILQLAIQKPGNVVPRSAAVRKTIMVASNVPQSISQLSHSASSMGREKFNSETVEDITTVEDEGESKSVYVGNLPSSVSASDLEQEFKNFGRIKANGVAVRSRKDSGGFYAFVEFEDVIGVQNALKASPIQLSGQQVYVEERKPSSGLPRGGRRGRGRGIYQLEATRGRFGGRSFGSGGADNGYRDNSNNRRSNGVYRRVPNQERGILGRHAMSNGQRTPEAY